jgi:hypothetical protein
LLAGALLAREPGRSAVKAGPGRGTPVAVEGQPVETSGVTAVKVRRVMDAALAGLLGGVIGASAGLAGSVLTVHLQAKNTETQRKRTHKEEAYANTLRYLDRVLGKASAIELAGADSNDLVSGKEYAKEFFDDVADAKYWLNSLTIVCAPEVRLRLQQARASLGLYAKFYPSELYQQVYSIVGECAQEDLGGYQAPEAGG